jgi:hypothetical protein
VTVLGPGDRVPAVPVWDRPGAEPVSLEALAAEGPFLLLFYLYDWSAT